MSREFQIVFFGIIALTILCGLWGAITITN